LHGAVEDLRAQLVDVMHGIRQMSHLIYPPVLDDFGAVAAIESTAAKYQEASTFAVRVECSDAAMRFAPPVELLLFRVFQEALTNVVKHAAATTVIVRLALEEGGVRLEIEDDGRGFDAHGYFRSPPASAGLGSLGMRERVAHLGGVVPRDVAPADGTHIVVRVPAAAAPRPRKRPAETCGAIGSSAPRSVSRSAGCRCSSMGRSRGSTTASGCIGAVTVWGWYTARLLIGFVVGISTWPPRWYLRGPLCGLLMLFPLSIVSLSTPGCEGACHVLERHDRGPDRHDGGRPRPRHHGAAKHA
jgi:hypothetical protein